MELFSGIFSSIWSIFLIVLFFGGSIFVHELGHFLAARRRGVKVERFSIGFGPKIFAWRGKDGVEYRLSWLPLGGYVALPQLADMSAIEGESEDVEKLPPVSYTTKVIVFVAGAVFNILFALVLATILWISGRPESEHVTSTRIGYVAERIELPDKTIVPSPAFAAGLKPGDKIISIDGKTMRSWQDILNSIVLSTRVDAAGERTAIFTIERDNSIQDITVKPVRTGEERFRKVGIDAAYEVLVKNVRPDSAGAKIGLQANDRFAELDGKRIWSLLSLGMQLSKEAGVEQKLTILRDGKPLVLTLKSVGADASKSLQGVEFTTNWRQLHQSPLEQIQVVLTNTYQTLTTLLHPKGDVSAQNMSGVIGIGRGFWDALQSDHPVAFVLWFTVMINVSLAFFNLLPIPVLDGGHIVLATIAKLRGKPLPQNFVLTTQSVFMVLLFGLMLYVTVFGDMRRILSDFRAEAAAQKAESSKAEPAKP
ncbi:site-2 protease family protein [Oleiharenicola lentus]|uniref:site-2 protease family protein n=1 Tax=Oleiharenicola lentus TaxID=2508720 RepID=UPI003F663C61